jgi:hypothetical protein
MAPAATPAPKAPRTAALDESNAGHAAQSAVAAGSAAPASPDPSAASGVAPTVAPIDPPAPPPPTQVAGDKLAKPSPAKGAVGKAGKLPPVVKVKDDPTTGGGETKPETKPAKEPKKESNEQSLDDLLGEAGGDKKKPAKPKLDRKELSADDFKHGMAAVSGKAAGCYKGTQGVVQVKLTIAASGQVSKVSVSGQFADKPEGTCVANAVKAASFPPWDGGPQSFGYPILLSE